MIAAARRRRGMLPALLVCGGLTIAVVAPLLHSGTLLLLDYGTYPAGPNPQLDASVWGFPPGLVTRAPVDVVLYAVFRALDWGWLRLLPFVIFAPLVWVGFRRLLGPRTLAVAAATILFVVNPWTDDRMSAGQVYLIVGYALLPILRNTFVGIVNVDRAVVESAIAMGMTDGQVLRQVQLPLAAQTILAGIRVATVTTIGRDSRGSKSYTRCARREIDGATCATNSSSH